MLNFVDDMDIFKGVDLKLLSIEQMLTQHPNWQRRAVLVKIANPARRNERDLKVIPVEATVEAMNEAIFHGIFKTHSLFLAWHAWPPLVGHCLNPRATPLYSHAFVFKN